jgi:hypothetical protein
VWVCMNFGNCGNLPLWKLLSRITYFVVLSDGNWIEQLAQLLLMWEAPGSVLDLQILLTRNFRNFRQIIYFPIYTNPALTKSLNKSICRHINVGPLGCTTQVKWRGANERKRENIKRHNLMNLLTFLQSLCIFVPSSPRCRHIARKSNI